MSSPFSSTPSSPTAIAPFTLNGPEGSFDVTSDDKQNRAFPLSIISSLHTYNKSMRHLPFELIFMTDLLDLLK